MLPQVLAGLHFLHRRCRIIHADLKPENVLLCVRDKGLQRLLSDAADSDRVAPGYSRHPQRSGLASRCAWGTTTNHRCSSITSPQRRS